MDNPGVVVAVLMAIIAVLSNAVSITIFIVRITGKIDVNNSTVIGKLDVMDRRVQHVENGINDLKNTDRRLALVEDRQNALATRQGNMEQDNLLIREDLGKLHQGLDRHQTTLNRFNEKQFLDKTQS